MEEAERKNEEGGGYETGRMDIKKECMFSDLNFSLLLSSFYVCLSTRRWGVCVREREREREKKRKERRKKGRERQKVPGQSRGTLLVYY